MLHDADYQAIEVEFEYPVAILRLNRPDKLNAFSRDLRAEAIAALDSFAADEEVRAVILCGAGRAFSAGYDLGGGSDGERPTDVVAWKERQDSSPAFWRAIWEFRKPLIAAVQGYCLGGACEITMLCDMTIASDDCKFGEPEIRFGMGSTLVMPWYIPLKIAKELLFTGSMITAQRAYEVGMVNHVVPRDDLMKSAMFYAQTVAAIAPVAAQLTKEGMNRAYEAMGFVNSVNYHDNLVAMMFGTKTAESVKFDEIRDSEGVRAALQWRSGQFKELEEKYS